MRGGDGSFDKGDLAAAYRRGICVGRRLVEFDKRTESGFWRGHAKKLEWKVRELVAEIRRARGIPARTRDKRHPRECRVCGRPKELWDYEPPHRDTPIYEWRESGTCSDDCSRIMVELMEAGFNPTEVETRRKGELDQWRAAGRQFKELIRTLNPGR